MTCEYCWHRRARFKIVHLCTCGACNEDQGDVSFSCYECLKRAEHPECQMPVRMDEEVGAR